MKQLICFHLIIFLFLFSSCACNNIECPKDRAIPDAINQLFPFETGYKLQFVSNTFDTLRFTCIKKEIFTDFESPGSRVQEECCNAAKVEGFYSSFEADSPSGFGFTNSNWYSTSFGCIVYNAGDTVAGEWNLADSQLPVNVSLAGQSFTNLQIGNLDSTIFLKSDSLVGIAGFKLNGKEWRKL